MLADWLVGTRMLEAGPLTNDTGRDGEREAALLGDHHRVDDNPNILSRLLPAIIDVARRTIRSPQSSEGVITINRTTDKDK